MGQPKSEKPVADVIDKVLGYLNFSSGNHDPCLYSNIDFVFKRAIESGGQEPTHQVVYALLSNRLDELHQSNDTFRCVAQSRAVIDIVFEKVLPAYRSYHEELLFHQTDELLFNSFFIASVFGTVLRQRPPWDESSRIVDGAINDLNDFIGHRPIATLESQNLEPYEHEWVRPIPLYIKGAGVATGKYHDIVRIAIQILSETSPDILRSAQFSPSRLEELAFDPRSFDFDHPINKRPNHHFGIWDSQQVEQGGFYSRFLVHQITVDSLLERSLSVEPKDGADSEEPHDPNELLFESAAVLAGTILMSSGICGGGPNAYDSSYTLSKLMPIVAGYRDDFYQNLLGQMDAKHRDRLTKEIKTFQQPFGGARQHLNARLAQQRANQLVNCRLATIFARMGYHEAAKKQSNVVPVASARITCEIDCLLSAARQAIERHSNRREPDTDHLKFAIEQLPKAFSLLQRGINCGAIIDPWNIIGFDANYSLFPALENSVRDHRAYELVDMVEEIFAVYSRLWSEAAANDRTEICEDCRTQFQSICDWWSKYAAHEVMAIDAVNPHDIFSAAELVATALNLWHRGGAAAGDIGFWSGHAALFDSPKAYALVINALLMRGDYTTSTALLVHWLSNANQIPLQQADSSFHNLLYRWITEQKSLLDAGREDEPVVPQEIWERIRKFHDFLEANAEHYWKIPEFRVGRSSLDSERELALDDQVEPAHNDEDSDDQVDLYGAAYEEMTYKDTTDDGIEGSIFESSSESNEELEAEVDRVLDRLEFLGTMASFWRFAATIPLPHFDAGGPSEEVCGRLNQRREIYRSWVQQATSNHEKILGLLAAVRRYALPQTGVDHESMIQYDRCRLFKESLLDQAIRTCVETGNAIRMLHSVIRSIELLSNESQPENHDLDGLPVEHAFVPVFSAIMLHDADQVANLFNDLTGYLDGQPLLYVPLSRGGDPAAIVSARMIQSAMRDLLGSLPKLGLIVQTHQLTETALRMERTHSVAQGAVTEFDDLFKVAYKSIVRSLVRSTCNLKSEMLQEGSKEKQEVAVECENVLFDCIETLTESMLILWLNHSKTLRLTVLEKVRDRESWGKLVEFIERYGSGLFTQQFLHRSNISSILHRGVGDWLEQLVDSPDPPDLRLLDELDKAIPTKDATNNIALVIEAVLENYSEYLDYNSTTTQSDHGEKVHVFLDFLRLRGRYERVCWNLRPVVWAHEILVREQATGVAKMWRRSLTERVGPEADKYLELLTALRDKHFIQMVSVGRRIEERFEHPMQIDRLRALVGPAMEDPQTKKSQRAFELLQNETKAFSRSTQGVGLDLPGWLASLEAEAAQFQLPERLKDRPFDRNLVDPVPSPIATLKEQLEQLPKREK